MNEKERTNNSATEAAAGKADIVERLKDRTTFACIQPTHLHWPDYKKGALLLDEAATEIASLREQLATFRDVALDRLDQLTKAESERRECREVLAIFAGIVGSPDERGLITIKLHKDCLARIHALNDALASLRPPAAPEGPKEVTGGELQAFILDNMKAWMTESDFTNALLSTYTITPKVQS